MRTCLNYFSSVTCHFSLCAFKIISLALVFSCVHAMGQCGFLCVNPLRVLWTSEICTLMLFTKFQKLLAIISSDIFSYPFFSFWDSKYSYVKSFDVAPKVTGSVIYLQPFFFFSDWLISIALSSGSLILFSVISVLLLSLSNV